MNDLFGKENSLIAFRIAGCKADFWKDLCSTKVGRDSFPTRRAQLSHTLGLYLWFHGWHSNFSKFTSNYPLFKLPWCIFPMPEGRSINLNHSPGKLTARPSKMMLGRRLPFLSTWSLSRGRVNFQGGSIQKKHHHPWAWLGCTSKTHRSFRFHETSEDLPDGSHPTMISHPWGGNGCHGLPAS